MTLEIPELVVLPDGTTAEVKAVAASVVAGELQQVVYTVERDSGAWSDVAAADVRLPAPAPAPALTATADREAPPALLELKGIP